MRNTIIKSFAAVAALRAGGGLAAASLMDAPYPAAVSLVTDEKLGWTYRQTGTNLPLYTFDRDPAGKSVCNGACATTWVPLLAEADAKPLGEWTIIVRDDKQRQWAFQKRPIYTHVHDSIQKPVGDGAGHNWHLLPYFR